MIDHTNSCDHCAHGDHHVCQEQGWYLEGCECSAHNRPKE
jgi:hypothetical protein